MVGFQTRWQDIGELLGTGKADFDNEIIFNHSETLIKHLQYEDSGPT